MKEKRVSLIIVGVIWLIIGIRVLMRGYSFLSLAELGNQIYIYLIVAFGIGIFKGKVVLKKVANKYYKRADVINFTKQDLYFGFMKILGARGAFLISLMVGLGILLRSIGLDKGILGTIYIGVGIALSIASLEFFKKSS